MRLDFGKTGSVPCALLGDAASQVPAYQLLSEGMRFEARLAHDACDFDIDYVFEVDDCLEDFGIEELALDLSLPHISRSSAGSSSLARIAACCRCPRHSAPFA